MVEDKDDIIDKFKDIDHSKEIEELRKPKEPKTVKASDNKDYDNFGYHWYPKQTGSSYGVMFGIVIAFLGLFYMIMNLFSLNWVAIGIGLIVLIFGYVILYYSSKGLPNKG